MKQLFVIRPHSVIDVITNSSSELFIVKGDQDIEMVKEFLKGIFADEKDYKYSIALVTKIHDENELYSVMFDMIEDITKFPKPYDFDKTARGKVINKLQEFGVDNLKVPHKEYCDKAGPMLKAMIENNEVDFDGEEYIPKIGDIIISGHENAIYGDKQQKIIEKFNAIRFFGEPI